jgi:hypothetical protein
MCWLVAAAREGYWMVRPADIYRGRPDPQFEFGMGVNVKFRAQPEAKHRLASSNKGGKKDNPAVHTVYSQEKIARPRVRSLLLSFFLSFVPFGLAVKATFVTK